MRTLLRLPEMYLILLILAVLFAVSTIALPAFADHDNGQGVGHQGDRPGRGGNGGSSDSSSTSSSSSTSNSDSSSGASVDSHDSYKGDDYEAAASSASIFLEGCNQGAAAQGMSFGLALGGESRICQLLRVAAAAQALGMHYEASIAVRQAFEEAGVRPGEQPLLSRASRWLRRQVVQPLFGWLPFVGNGA